MFGIECCVSLILMVSITAAQEELYFSQSPKDVDVVTGNSVTLPCEVTPSDGVEYYWELNGSKIANTTRRFQRGSDLHITRADRERDSGQFRCIADSKGSSITSSAASLNIQWIEEPSVQLQSPASASYITPGSEVILRCHLEASGDVHFEWFRNADRLVKTARIDIKKKRLHIKTATPSDNGIYKCAAKNEAGTRHSVRNFALAVSGDQTALIQTVPENQLVKKGGTAYFDCVYQHADVIEWYFKDIGPLESSSRIAVHSNGTLQIDGVQSSDQGRYNCVGIKSESTEVPQSYTAELRLAYIHNFSASSFEPVISINSTQIVAEGSDYQLTCLEPESLPPAKKWWMSPAGHTISDSGQVRVDDDGRLIIEKTLVENAGNYTCVAENTAGQAQISIELVVTTKPIITEHPSSVSVDENETSTLLCLYDTKSEDRTTVRWTKDGYPFGMNFTDGNNNQQRIKIARDNGTLTIQSTKISDRGVYICEVVTDGFRPVVSKPATISVIEKLKFAPAPVNKKLELGTAGKIHCKAQGTPPPVIRWKMVGSNGLGNHVNDLNGTLHFPVVVAEDRGKYVCTATNSQGEISATVNVEVVVAPKFSVLPKNPTEAIEGSAISIDCVVEGDPKPTIQWDKNSKMNDFDHSRFTVLENGTLFISEVHREDENNYGCTAGSSAGLNRKEVRLIVHGRDHQADAGNEGSAVTKAVLITMSVAAAYIILVVGLMVWCRYRRRSRKLPINDASKTENGDIDHTELKEGVNGHGPGPSKSENSGAEAALKEGQKSDGAETTHSQSSNHSKKSKSNYDKLALSRSHLKDNKLIGRGEFGDIMVAKIAKSATSCGDKRNSAVTTPNGTVEDKELPVLVKSLSQTKDENSLAEFKREIDMFAKLSHENVTKLFGLCREVEPHYMILEYTDWGDLKQFLVATQKGDPPPLTAIQCLTIIQQLARGMDHLASARMIHKDLAARNCVVTSKLVAKIGLPRLTRDPYSHEYCKHMNQIIPLRWMPHEAVYEDEFSTKSDVYAFGVVIWEIFYQGELPFPKMNDNSFLSKLKEKSLEWKFHKDTPPALQKLQETCLDTNPQERPTFAAMVKDVEELLKSM